MRCHSVTFLKLPEKITLILIPDIQGYFFNRKLCIAQQKNRHLKSFSLQKLLKIVSGFLLYQLVSRLCNWRSHFILRCKLEEGRRLLQFTNKPISTISTFCVFQARATFRLPSKNSLVWLQTNTGASGHKPSCAWWCHHDRIRWSADCRFFIYHISYTSLKCCLILAVREV